MSAFCPESCPDADACVVGLPCLKFPTKNLIDHERNIYVWIVGGIYHFPYSLYAEDDYIHEFAENNPRYILFFGPRELGDVNWNKY